MESDYSRYDMNDERNVFSKAIRALMAGQDTLSIRYTACSSLDNPKETAKYHFHINMKRIADEQFCGLVLLTQFKGEAIIGDSDDRSLVMLKRSFNKMLTKDITFLQIKDTKCANEYIDTLFMMANHFIMTCGRDNLSVHSQYIYNFTTENIIDDYAKYLENRGFFIYHPDSIIKKIVKDPSEVYELGNLIEEYHKNKYDNCIMSIKIKDSPFKLALKSKLITIDNVTIAVAHKYDTNFTAMISTNNSIYKVDSEEDWRCINEHIISIITLFIEKIHLVTTQPQIKIELSAIKKGDIYNGKYNKK